MKRHIFESTKAAYNATMIGEEVSIGDILIIPSEKVVGVAYAWPFALTEDTGALHALANSDSFNRLSNAIKFFNQGGVEAILEGIHKGIYDEVGLDSGVHYTRPLYLTRI
jgi:hypothetical protein